MIKVRVPATSANLGPGFDTLGLSLGLYNEFIFEETCKGIELVGFEEEYDHKDNLVYLSMMETFKEVGYSPRGIKIDAKINIPISRGLGSSASCILAGIIGANKLSGDTLSIDEIFYLATKIEGHPDNIAPALFGGLVVSLMDGNKVLYNKIEIAKGIKFVALIPDFTLSTKESREVLPSTIEFKDAINNVSRVSFLLSALVNGKFNLLKYCFKDRLHEPYRGKLIPDFSNLIEQCEEIGALGAYLSGAGPTIMCIIDQEDEDFTKTIRSYLNTLESIWSVKELTMDLEGIRI